MLEVYNEEDPKGTCERLDLCEVFDVRAALVGEEPIDFAKHIDVVNSNVNSTWVAGHNDKFAGASKKEIQRTLGTVVDPDWTLKAEFEVPAGLYADDIPDTFDSRTNWPKCEYVINNVRDQANCGSCWAHGTTEAFNDRKCIESDGFFHDFFSVSDTTGCCNFLQCQSMGCNGGQVATPWKWFTKKGVVTGGNLGDNIFCYDYTMPQCAHHVESTTMKPCEDIPQVAPKCESTCPNNKAIDYTTNKSKAASSYGFGMIDNVEKIKADIAQYGTVTAAFTVYEDFPTYKSGVYQHTTGSALGGHAIKVIGWGNEDGTDYWLAVNSWNNTWGDKGLFKIKQGDCGIDRQMHAGRP